MESILETQIQGVLLSEYVKNRPGIKVSRLKTTQATPPKEFVSNLEAAVAPAESVEPPAPALTDSEVPEPQPLESSGAEAFSIADAMREATAEAAARLRQKHQDPVTEDLRAASVKDKAGVPQAPGDEKSERQGTDSSRQKLRKLASEVLEEVKRSKID